MHTCPNCEFESESRRGLGIHHARMHGESIEHYERRQNAEFECPTCGEPYETKRGLSVHHARTHGETIWGVEFTCAHCGDDFRGRADRNEAKHVFCSVECKGEWQAEHLVGEDNPGWSGGGVEVECEWCDTPVIKTKFDFEHQNRHFCSRECQVEWQRESEINSGENSPQWTGGKPEFECAWCGDTVRRKRRSSTERRFCDSDCFGSWLSENQRRENHPNWKGGSKPYGSGWHDSKRESVRQRDGYQCRHCGMTTEQHKEEFGRDLEVHHIIPARKFDDAEKRNSMDNLVTLCRKHHQLYEKTPGIRPNNP